MAHPTATPVPSADLLNRKCSQAEAAQVALVTAMRLAPAIQAARPSTAGGAAAVVARAAPATPATAGKAACLYTVGTVDLEQLPTQDQRQ
jgi:hypothetical protein